jgi:ACS family tartrate transporter-like MFS transporter
VASQSKTRTPPADDGGMQGAIYRKVAWRTLPLLGVGYLFAYMDRVNIGFGAAQMNADLGFNAAVYGFGGGLFFLSYALMEVPSNLMFQRFGARIWFSRIMFTWGLLAAAGALVRDAGQFYALRLLLGAAEAGFFPAAIVYLARWYPLATRARALSSFYVAFPLSSLVMGALAHTLMSLGGTFGLRGWQWLLVVEGLPAVLVGAAFLLWLPERPANAGFLTDEEKRWLEAKLDAPPASEGHQTVAEVLRVLANPRVLVLGLVNACFLGTIYCFNLTGPQVLGLRTGFSDAGVGWLVALGGLLGAVSMISSGLHADRKGEHHLHSIAPLIVVAGGFALLAVGHSAALAVPGYLATMIGMNAFNGVYFVLVSRLLSGRILVVAAAAVNMLGQLGSFILPSLYGLAQARAGHMDAVLWMLPIPFLLAAVLLVGVKLLEQRTPAPVAVPA